MVDDYAWRHRGMEPNLPDSVVLDAAQDAFATVAARAKPATNEGLMPRGPHAKSYNRTRPLSHPTARRLPSADQASTAAIAGS